MLGPGRNTGSPQSREKLFVKWTELTIRVLLNFHLLLKKHAKNYFNRPLSMFPKYYAIPPSRYFPDSTCDLLKSSTKWWQCDGSVSWLFQAIQGYLEARRMQCRLQLTTSPQPLFPFELLNRTDSWLLLKPSNILETLRPFKVPARILP